MMIVRWIPLALLGAGCFGDTATGSGTDTASTTGAPTGTDDGSAGTLGDSTAATMSGGTQADDTSAGSDGAVFDLPHPDTPDRRGGCDAVDFLFVIDDSSSMFEHQQNLVANFPAFIDGIEATLDTVASYQVGVIATDAYSWNDPPACILLGALVTSTEGAGPQSSNAICGPYASGLAYMTEQDDLDQTFSCAAQVGTMGNGFERPMEAMVTTVGKSLGDAGECNEGFLRDDALLVIVVITDEYDGPGDPEAEFPNGEDPPTSTGDPQSWFDAVVAAKNGFVENAVALAITNWDGGPCPPVDLGHDGANIVEWVELFGAHGFLGGLCEPDYGPFFAEATAVIDQACSDFMPPQ